MNLTADALSFALVHSLWQDGLVSLLLWSALVVLRHWSANARYVVCCGALTLMTALPVVTMVALSEPQELPMSVLLRAGAPSAPALVAPAPGDNAVLMEVPSSTSEVLSSDWLSALTPWMLPLWLAGVLVCSLRLVLASLHTVTLKRQSVVEDGPLAATVARLAERIGVCRAVSVRVSTVMASPATLGFLRPVILLPPAAALGVTPQQLEALLAHELAHVRRHDFLVNVLQMITETLFFYHPAVWWTSRRIRIERELCCDDIAVKACGDPVSYAQALTVVARLLVTQPGIAVGAAGGPLLVRVQRLLGVASTVRPVSPLWVATTALVMIVALMFVDPYAQSRAPEAPTAVDNEAVLRGRVVDAATGRALAGASVRAQYITGVENPTKCPIGDCESVADPVAGRIPNYRITTGPDGRFTVHGVKSGDYLVAAVAPGYVQGYFGEISRDMPEIPVHVSPGEAAPSIDVRLEPAGSLSGRILSDAGEGLPGVEVELLRRMYLPRSTQPVAIAFAQTEERGTFRFRNVAPGEYYVRAYASPSTEPTRKDGTLSYVTTFFTGATDVTFAQPVILSGGQELDGVDFALMTSKTRRVSGRLVDPAGASLSTALVHLIPHSTGRQEVRKMIPRADGSFRFDDVPAAGYLLTIADSSDRRSWVGASRELTVLDDVTDLLLVAGPSVSVDGRVVRDDGRPLPFDLTELRIGTERRDGSLGIHSDGSADVASDGAFSMRSGVGLVHLRIVGLRPRWFVKSAALGGLDITDAPFELTPGQQPRLAVTLSDRVSRISGTVTDRSARPVANALVLIFPDDRTRWENPSSIYTTFSRQEGHYEIDALPRMKYRVIAVTSLPRNAWTDPNVLARLWPLGSPPLPDDLGVITLHLRVVPPPADLLQ